MIRTTVATSLLFCLCTPVFAAEADSCATVRLAEPGWNDLALTTGAASVVLEGLGYTVKSDLLGIEVIYQSLKENELDAFLGYWDPAMQTYAAPYEADGSVERVRVNLDEAKYTFAVPSYVAEAGVRDFKDLARFGAEFGKEMHGIEPGSNQLMFDVIADPAFGLEGWNVVESSETAMLLEVQRKVDRKEFVVFQAWAPHPMNNAFDLVYLTGGDAHYGPNFGAATVSTQVRKGYLADCPNVGKFLQNLSFDIAFENEGMGYLINESMDPREAGQKILAARPEVLDGWLKDVTTRDGQPGLAAVKAALGL
ncbi:choline ABC transporter substrate-binding protein [Paragemmobacter straminiformis]|uniref:Choline ABC transporter substrate-binding protein n=1 Tax=Paragemmobacter straminiformis TaxID=2045119 RepID=A0A842I6U2_9RHOB|nr:choline ABC transporter substrate-binding protein [Gemmobacter straminiformis]MBC2835087.1 choline ABC transporter substrate-binding protein [Gemmobacter straminiformis]